MKRATRISDLFYAIVILAAQAAQAQTSLAPNPTPAAPAIAATGTTSTSDVGTPTAQEMAPIIVTGSAIPTTDTEGASPVTVIDSTQIKQRGYQNVNDVMRNLPQSGGEADSGLDGTSFTPGAAYISLRGLGPQATLILINGRRVANYPGLANGQYPFVDVSGIPVQIIDHIEILTEGTALYGSDAIAGVVNIITKKSLPSDENGEFDTFIGNTTHKDSFLQRYTLMGNLETFDKNGFGIIEADYEHQNSIFAGDRALSSTANQTANGGFDLRSSRTYPGYFLPGNVVIPPPPPPPAVPPPIPGFTVGPGVRGNVPLTPGSEVADTPDPYDYNPASSVFPDTTRYGMYLNYTYKFYEGNITPNIDFQYQHNRTISQEAASGYSLLDGDTGPFLNAPNLGQPAFIVPANNPYNQTGLPVDILSYRFVPLGPRIEAVDSDDFRAVPSIDFKLGNGWTLNAALNYSYQFVNDRSLNEVNVLGFQNALDSTNPATAYNPFTSTGFQSPAALSDITAEDGQKNTYSIIGEDFRLNGTVTNLPAGPIQMAFGGEYRLERFNQRFSDEAAAGDVLDQAPQGDTAASRKVLSGYTEVDFPLTSPSFNIPGFYQTDVIADGRVDKYTDFGSTENPQIRLRWETIPGLVLRFSYGKSFRAPSLNELSAGGNGSFVFVNNPKYLNPVTDTTIAQVEQNTPGNPNLKPETAETFSFGVAYTPEAIKGLLITGDYFKIRYNNQIQDQDAQTLVDENSPQVHYLPSGAISSIDVGYANLNNSYIEGFDWGANYVLGDPNTDWGQLTFNVQATYYRKYVQDDGTGAVDYVGTDTGGLGSFSRYRQDASITWGYRNFTYTLSNDYTSGFADGSDLYGEARNVDAWFVFDMQMTYTFDKELVEHEIAPGPATDGFDWRNILEGTTVTVGCNNVVDEQPPFVADPNDTLGYDQSYSDGTGRFVYGELTKKF